MTPIYVSRNGIVAQVVIQMADRPDALNWDLLNDGIGNPKNTLSLLLSHQTPPVMITGVRASAEDAVRAGIKYISGHNHDFSLFFLNRLQQPRKKLPMLVFPGFTHEVLPQVPV